MASRCKGCGLPADLGKRMYWTSWGEIYSRPSGGERLLFLDTSWVRLLAEEARRGGGEDLMARLREYRREHTRRRAESALRGWGSFLLRRRLTGERLLRELLEELPRYGYGRFEILEFKPRKHLKLRATHPYDDLFLFADLWGMWEAAQRVKASAATEHAGAGSLVLTLKTEGREGKRNRSRETCNEPAPSPPKAPSPLKKDEVIPLCPRCRKPLYTGRMSWDGERGTIVDERSGRRFIISPLESWKGVFLLLRQEYPQVFQSFTGRLVEMSVLPGRDGGGGDLKGAYRDFFLSLPFLGWGKPVRVVRKPFLVDAEMLATPFPDLLAAEMKGRFGSLEREEWSVEVRFSGDGRHRFIMGPSMDGPWLPLDSLLPPRSHPGIILPW
jgi:hypothetical protein